MNSGTKTGWLSAAAAVLVTAGLAAAQAPANRAIDSSDYSSRSAVAGRPVVSVPDNPSPPAAVVQPAALTFDAPPGGPVETQGAGPAAPWPGNPFADLPESGPPPYRVWASADFLVWKIKSASLPSLAATVPFGVLEYQTQLRPGILDNNFVPISIQTTATLAEGNTISQNEQFGGRFTAGVWLDREQDLGIDGSFFFLNTHSTGFASNTGNSVNQATIPLLGDNNFFIPGTTIPTQSLPAFLVRQATNNLTGTASSGLWGAELNARCASASLGAVSGFAGFRYINFHEDLGLQDSFQLFLPTGTITPGSGNSFGTNLPNNLQYSTQDRITTHNDFYGGQVGLNLDMFVNRFIVDLCGKVALGVMHQSADVSGSSVQSNGTITAGGLLSGPLDNGTHSRNVLSWVPELDAKVGYMLTPSVRVYVGYDFMYLWNVLRPSDQFGTATSGATVTVAGVPTPITVTEPAFRFKDSDVWVQGVNVGVEVRY